MILHPKIVLTPSCQHCGAAGPDTSRSQAIWGHGHRSHELKADQGGAGPYNLGIGSASKFIVVAC
jgi:hypothetical protein